MSKSKSVLGIAVLFALALSAFGASSASATGLTAFTCVTDPAGDRKGDHCLTTGSGAPAKHVEIPPAQTTTITATNANTAEETNAARSATLKGALGGVVTEVTCATVSSKEGTFQNKTNASGEMYAHAEGKLHYEGCEVKAPAGKGCKVSGGTILTSQLTGTSEGQLAAGHTFKITPKEAGAKFTEIKIEGCSIESLNNTFPVTGAVKAVAEGATLSSTHATVTTQNELKFGGVKAGLDGAITIKGHKAGEETNPLTVTTTP